MVRRTRTHSAAASLLLLALAVPTATAASGPATPSDFNGDGFADLAVGAKQYKSSPSAGGTVNVIYGSLTGLTAAGEQLWSQNSPGVKGTVQGWINSAGDDYTPGDEFGAAVASGDFDRDGFADLAIGAPSDSEAGIRRGAVNVLHGSPAGLSAAGDQLWTRNNIPGQADVPGAFGATLESADFNGDGFWDLAVGVRDVDGAVRVLFGSPVGLTTTGSVLLAWASPLVPDEIGAAAGFGASLASGDVDMDGRAELAVGAPAATVNGLLGAGAVALLFGDPGGFRTDGTLLWNQDAPNVAGAAAAGNLFGFAVELGDFNGDGAADLAAGAPKDVKGGTVTILYASGQGLSGGSHRYHQDVGGVPSAGETGDWFGSNLVAGRFDADEKVDLAVAAALEDVGGILDAGAVTVMYGDPEGVSPYGAQLWTEQTAGVPGLVRTHDRFGTSLAAGNYGLSGRTDLAIGAPGWRKNRERGAGEVLVLYGHRAELTTGGAQRWTKASAGIHGIAGVNDQFGAAVSP